MREIHRDDPAHSMCISVKMPLDLVYKMKFTHTNITYTYSSIDYLIYFAQGLGYENGKKEDLVKLKS